MFFTKVFLKESIFDAKPSRTLRKNFSSKIFVLTVFNFCLMVTSSVASFTYTKKFFVILTLSLSYTPGGISKTNRIRIKVFR